MNRREPQSKLSIPYYSHQKNKDRWELQNSINMYFLVSSHRKRLSYSLAAEKDWKRVGNKCEELAQNCTTMTELTKKVHEVSRALSREE